MYLRRITGSTTAVLIASAGIPSQALSDVNPSVGCYMTGKFWEINLFIVELRLLLQKNIYKKDRQNYHIL